MLFLSELETGRAVVSLTSTRAAPIVREVLDGLSETALRAGITLGAELDEEAEVPLRPRMLRVAIGNLAENAIRYAGDGATFSIRVSREGDETVITAADDGVGVSDEDLQRLFERFYRSDRARASRGTGPRARDREAHRDERRRAGRGVDGPGSWARDHDCLPRIGSADDGARALLERGRLRHQRPDGALRRLSLRSATSRSRSTRTRSPRSSAPQAAARARSSAVSTG